MLWIAHSTSHCRCVAAALPPVGRLRGRSVLRPTARVIAAARVKNLLFVGELFPRRAGAASLQIITLETGRQ